MKKILALVFCLSVFLGANSCTKESPADDPNEIVFSSSFFSAERSPMTKAATEVNNGNLSSFFVVAGQGTVRTWTSPVSFSGTYPGKYKGTPAQYWPEESSATYKFAASNVSLNTGADNYFVPYIPLSRELLNTDVVVAYLPSATWKSVNEFSFTHILARLGSVTVAAESGYTISDVEILIYDNYNVASYQGYVIPTGTYGGSIGGSTYISAIAISHFNTSTPFENRTGVLATHSIANSTVGTKSNDIYLFPGTYTVDARWKATMGSSTKEYKSSTTVELGKGEVTNLSTTLGGVASEIEFTITVSPWTPVTKELTFSPS